MAADEAAADLARRVDGVQRPPGHGQPDVRAVLLRLEVVGDLALRGVGLVAGELVLHVRERAEQPSSGIPIAQGA